MPSCIDIKFLALLNLQYSRNRTQELQEIFLALNGNNRDGYLTAQDLVDAAAAVQQDVSLELAQHMLALASSANDNQKKKKNSSQSGLRTREFIKFWEPPDP